MENRPARKRSRKRLGTKIHRWTGMGSLAIVLVIAVTGILLNHTESLGLNERRVTSAGVLRHYGIEPQGEPSVFRADDHLLAAWDGQLLFNDVVVDFAPEDESLIAAGKVKDGEYSFVFPTLVVVCDEIGGLLDRLDEASLPEGRLKRAGASAAGALVVETENGEALVLKDWIEIVTFTDKAPEWFEPAGSAGEADRKILARAIRGEGLPLSRIITDLHSGRFFGIVGVILYDIAAILLVVLGITGVGLWLRRR